MTQSALVVIKMLFQIGIFTSQRVERLADGARLDRYRIAAVGIVAQRGRDQNVHSHRVLLRILGFLILILDCRVETRKKKLP